MRPFTLLALAALTLPGLIRSYDSYAQTGVVQPVASTPTPAAPSGAPRSRYIHTSDGVRLHLLETTAPASREGAPVKVLLVPGWSMPATIWRNQMAIRARGIVSVAALDPRGQGRSEVPDSGYTIDRRADDLNEVISDLFGQNTQPGARLVLVGWSLGALEALHYLHRHGDLRVAGLVLVDSSIGEGQPAPATTGNGTSRMASSFTEELRRDRRTALAAFMKAIFKRLPPQSELDELTDGALRMPLEASLALFPSKLPSEHWRNATRGYTRPMLYVVTPQFAAQAERLRLSRPATQIELFPQAGHALFADEPERFNRLLAEFINALPVR